MLMLSNSQVEYKPAVVDSVASILVVDSTSDIVSCGVIDCVDVVCEFVDSDSVDSDAVDSVVFVSK